MGTPLPRFSYLVVFFCFAAVVSFGQQVSSRPLITNPLVESELTTLKGNTHPLAQARFDIGMAPPDLPMNRMLLVLKRSPEQEHSLRTLLDNQQDKASPQYHKWLTPKRFGTQFGPADQDVQTVTGWLQSHGFEVNRVSHGRTVIEFSGTEAQVEEALHTSIHKYAVNGEEHWANASDPQIPAALAPAVAGVWSLHNFRKKPQLTISNRQFTAKYVPGSRPQFTSGSLHALAPADFYKIYNVNPLFGPGPSIAIVGRSNINVQDVVWFHYWTYDQATMPQVVVNGTDPGDLGGGEEMEAVLDSTWSGAVAPGASVTLVVSASTNTTDGVDLSEEYIIDNNMADVMSESFGDCEANYTSAEASAVSNLAQQAAIQGITYFVASGDSGAAGCDDPNSETIATHSNSVNILASSPYVIAVGGTAFNENGHDSTYWSATTDQTTLGSALSYIPEDVWNQSCTSTQCGSGANLFASGGGPSVFFQKPAWQTGVAGIPSDGFRDVPDVSLTAALHDPYLLCVAGSCAPDAQGYIHFYGVGGTSVSSPAFAAILGSVAAISGSRQGQANYVLYRLAAGEPLSQCNASNTTASPAVTCIFNDVTIGNNAVPGESGYGTGSALYRSGIGYDLPTGLGSVNVANLVKQWNTVTFNATSTSFSISPVNFVHGSQAGINVKVTANDNGTPSGPVWIQGGPSHGNLVGDSTAVLFMLDSAGSVFASTHLMPGGTYQVNAHYAGDGKYGPSDSSPPVWITVQSESSTTTLSMVSPDPNGNLVPFTSGPYGTPVYLQAHVTGASGYGTPTSYVNFWDSGNGIASAYVDKNGNADPPKIATLSVGKHSLRAGYYGDASFGTSISSTTQASISAAGTSITISGVPAQQGALLAATVSTSGYGNSPTGTVTFYSGSTSIGNSQLTMGTAQDGTTQGLASFSASQLGTGQYSLSASYGGDSNYVASSSAPTTINIQPDFSIQASTNALSIQTPGSSGSMTVSMTDLDGFTGAVTFSCLGLPSEAQCVFSPATLSATGSTTLSVTTVAKTGTLRRGVRGRQWSFALAMLSMTIGGVFMLGVPLSHRRRRKLLLTILLGGLCVSCGGGGGSVVNTGPPPNPGTPQGSYVITLNATSGATTHSVQFGLGVL